ncbi:MAG: 2-oxoacid:acceptor oxidoreductase subunit alpha [Polyangiales bacterium]
MEIRTEPLTSVVVRFAGDSGDGMQLTGSQFTETSALAGNDLATFPDYPAEIRAPAGTLAGVSGFQVHFASEHVFTPGDQTDVLVAMNPAALKANLKDVRPAGTLILDTADFTEKNLERAKWASDPRTDGTLKGYTVIEVNITELTLRAIDEYRLPTRTATRSKNMFALGLVYWMFGRSPDHTIQWLDQKFGKKNEVLRDANTKALKAGFHYGETHEYFAHRYTVAPAKLEPGLYRNVAGNDALAYGLMAAAERAKLSLFYAGYPITPASPILHALAARKGLGVRTMQAEDEIAAVCAAVGASYGGALGVTASSGPGIALKQEAISLALTLELPLVVVNVQRAGPSTGMPTKTEQADLFQAIFGRHGESPLPVIAAQSPSDCFDAAYEAARIAVEHMTPVMLLSDGYIANGAEPWRIPNLETLKAIHPVFATKGEGTFLPYDRDDKLSRPWALPGTPGLEHRLGGLEKEHRTGNISYDPDNHDFMSRLRADKVERIRESLPPLPVDGASTGDLLVVSWGGTFGSVRKATQVARSEGLKVTHVHLRHVNPLPRELEALLRAFPRVLVPELNLGQLATVLRSRFVLDVRSFTKMKGQPFRVSELVAAFRRTIEGGDPNEVRPAAADKEKAS